jgi:hypothetical protein
VIGGLLVSTVLSLVFVPAVFTVLDDAGRLLGRGLGRFIGGRDEPDEGPPHAPGFDDRGWERPPYPRAAE